MRHLFTDESFSAPRHSCVIASTRGRKLTTQGAVLEWTAVSKPLALADRPAPGTLA
jgi:hypothetical protein